MDSTDITLIIIVGLISLLIGVMVAMLFDYTLGTPWVTVSATIIEKSFTPSSTHTGVGPVIGGKGGVAVTVSSSPAEWTLIIKTEDGSIEPIEVEKEEWATYEKGQIVKIQTSKGKWSGYISYGDIVK